MILDHKRGLTFRDVVTDAVRTLRSRPARAAGIMVGIILGVGSAVATNGLAATSRFQVSDSFDVLRATQVDIQVLASPSVPLDEMSRRLDLLTGVRAAGVVVTSQASTLDVSSTRWTANSADSNPRLLGVDAGFLSATETAVLQGQSLSQGMVNRRASVAVVGSTLAADLGISGDESETIYVDRIPVSVLGVLKKSTRYPQMNNAVVLPFTTLQDTWPQLDFGSFIVRVDPGHAEGISKVAAVTMQPEAPSVLNVTPPADPRGLRGQVDGQLQLLGLAVSGFALLVGVLSIAGATAAAVNERLGEFGLRRAVGAFPSDLRRLVLTECLLLGLVAGTIGTALGVVLVLSVSLAQGWTPVLSREVVLAAPLLGVATGVAAGAFPARRAARIQPVDALRA